MEGHGNGPRGADSNLTDVLWRQMQSVAEAMIERQSVLERKMLDPAIHRGINLFIVDLIGHWIDRLAREPEPERRRDLEHLLRVVGAESRKPRVDTAVRTLDEMTA